MGHHHEQHHSHDHQHHHGTGNIAVAFWLNLLFCIIEFAGGFFTNSVSILSDALHDLGDSFSLGLAWYFQKVSAKKRDRDYSYGYGRFSLLGAVINSIILIVGAVFILQETIPRLIHPEASNAKGMILLAIFGIAVNGIAALRLRKGQSINEKVLSLHFIEDILGWAAILIGGIVMIFAEVPILDPILSLLITAFVLFNVFKNLKSSFKIFLQGTPGLVNQEEVKKKILEIPGIKNLHDLHIWTLEGQYNVMTIHLVVAGMSSLEESEIVKQKVKSLVQELHIQHVTIEIESEGENCGLINC